MQHIQIKRLRAVAAKRICLTLFIAGAFSFNACTGPREEVKTVSAPPPAQTQPVPMAQPTQTAPPASPTPGVPPTLAPPQTTDINNKLAQIFQGAVQLDTAQQVNSFSGDFNGDGSEDIAIVVKPVANKLADINSEVANWILEDPHLVVLPDPTKAVQTLPAPPAPTNVQAADILLTVIHGHKETGWRNPDAQQTYLLKNAVGRDLSVQARQNAPAVYKASFTHLHGDIIIEEMARGYGCIYWTGAKYAWLSAPKPKT